MDQTGYDLYKEDYIDLKDFFAGERAVKEKKDRYTPELEGHKNKPTLYETYKNFGILYNALSRTRQGLKGAMLRKPIDIQFPENQMEHLEVIMADGGSFYDLARETTDQVLGYGRCGALVDITEDEKPCVALYDALAIIDWPKSRKPGTKQEILLAELVEQAKQDEPGETEIVHQRRRLELDEAGFYKVTAYQKSTKEGSDDWEIVLGTDKEPNPRIPNYKGKKLTYIPFVFFGSSSNVPNPSKPPLLDLLNILKGHWRLTVAYQYGLHFAGLPTPCFAGFDFDDGAKIPLGPGVAYHASEPKAKSWFLQTEGVGLSDMEKGLDRLERQMAVIGARLLEEQRPGVEAAETVRLRSSGDSASLADIAGNVGLSLTQVLKYIGFWLGVNEKQVQVTMNKDFISSRLSPQDIVALLAAVQAGQISEDTFIFNLIQGEVLQTGKTVEQEKEGIAEDKIKNAKENKNLDGLSGSFD